MIAHDKHQYAIHFLCIAEMNCYGKCIYHMLSIWNEFWYYHMVLTAIKWIWHLFPYWLLMITSMCHSFSLHWRNALLWSMYNLWTSYEILTLMDLYVYRVLSNRFIFRKVYPQTSYVHHWIPHHFLTHEYIWCLAWARCWHCEVRYRVWFKTATS